MIVLRTLILNIYNFYLGLSLRTNFYSSNTYANDSVISKFITHHIKEMRVSYNTKRDVGTTVSVEIEVAPPLS